MMHRRVVALGLLALAHTASSLRALKAAVIIPGFLNDANDFAPLAASLTAKGIPTAVVPLPIWHWIPQVGGRSVRPHGGSNTPARPPHISQPALPRQVRPILERIDHAVRHVAAMGEAAESASQPLRVPDYEYSLPDLWTDFLTNPGGVGSVGGSQYPDEYPTDVEPCGSAPTAGPAQGRVAIIGHSASGWMARIYLSSRAYGGKAYDGANLVHSLVTLGTPHMTGACVPFYSVEWANREPAPSGVRCLAVGGSGLPGDSSGGLTEGAYSFCTPDGTGGESMDGDGLTTLESAIALDGAETMVLDGTTHYPWSTAPFADWIAPELTKAYREGQPWYGSDQRVERWLPWLVNGIELEKSAD